MLPHLRRQMPRRRAFHHLRPIPLPLRQPQRTQLSGPTALQFLTPRRGIICISTARAPSRRIPTCPRFVSFMRNVA
jgi:hypothetical protein